VLAAHESGDLAAAVAGGHDTFKKWINGVGKAQKRKGKRLFMPMRVALTVRAGVDLLQLRDGFSVFCPCSSSSSSLTSSRWC
jgi:hypothetical protein